MLTRFQAAKKAAIELSGLPIVQTRFISRLTKKHPGTDSSSTVFMGKRYSSTDNLLKTKNLQNPAQEQKSWYDKDNRTEFYSAIQSLQGLMLFSGGIGLLWSYKIERNNKKVELGRNITFEIEKAKTSLKCLMNEWDIEIAKSLKNTQGFDAQKFMEKIDLKKINKYESHFSDGIRMATRYDSSIVPETLQIEADYQNELFRQALQEISLCDQSATYENIKLKAEKLRHCFGEIYNVLNVVGIVASANTIEKKYQTQEQKEILEKFKQKLAVDEIRQSIDNLRTPILLQLKKDKEKFKQNNPDSDKLVRHKVFGNPTK